MRARFGRTIRRPLNKGVHARRGRGFGKGRIGWRFSLRLSDRTRHLDCTRNAFCRKIIRCRYAGALAQDYAHARGGIRFKYVLMNRIVRKTRQRRVHRLQNNFSLVGFGVSERGVRELFELFVT